MGRTKTLAQQIAELDEPLPKDFDPEEERPAQGSDEDSGSEESDDGLAGTEHYVEVGKSKLRKRDEVALGPQYSGSRISREQLLEDDDEGPESESGDEGAEGVFSIAPTYADPEASDFEIDDEDGDINSDEALGESDEEKFKDFTFRGSGKPREKVGARKRATAVDFMSDSEEEELERDGPDETDENLLDIDAQHAEDLEDDEGSSDDESDGEDMLVFEEHESVGSDDENDEGSGEEDSDDEGMDLDSEQEDEDEEEDDESDAGDDEAAKRAELRKMMSEEQKTVVATISQAAKADADKGNAVKQQRKAFDSLLNVRIRLQKALVATNTMATIEDKDGEDVPAEPYQGAQEAAIQLWNTLDKIRSELCKANSPESNDKKRKRIDTTTSSSNIWKRMKTSEVASIDVRQTTLEKWSAKVKGATALPLSRKLNATASQQTITSVLQEQIASSDHLVKRTKYPRSCAPVQAKQKITEDPNIFDDADFYQMLLKELVDQRMMDSSGALAIGENGKPTQWTAVKEAKTRKNVVTKASKGRKMRFTVHEKLQNFMAPEDRGSWEPDAIDRFFGTLLGQKMTLGEDEQEVEEEDDGGVPLEEEGLMLFRS